MNLEIFDKNLDVSTNAINKERLDIIYSLGYDLSSNRSQGKIYITYDRLFDNIESAYMSYAEKDIRQNKRPIGMNTKFYENINVSETIKKHFNSQTLKNKNRRLRRLKDSKLDDNLLKKLNKLDKVYAFSRHQSTKILAIDIDNHDNNAEKALRAFKYIVANYYNAIIYTEVSKNLGFHIFISTNEKMSQDVLMSIQNQINWDGYKNIEVIGAKNSKQLLRIIESPQYHAIEYNKELTEANYITEHKYRKNIKEFNHKNRCCRSLIPNIVALKKQAYLSKLLINSTSELPIWGNRTNSKKYKNKQEIIEVLKTKYPFGAGERVEHMRIIASACYYYGLSANDYIEITLSNNNGSKDLQKWGINEIIRIYTKYFEYFENKYNLQENKNIIIDNKNNKTYNDKKFYSNIGHIRNNPITNTALELVSNIILHKQILPNLKYKKWIDEYKKVVPLLIKEIVGTIIYNETNKKTKNKDSTLTYKKFKQLSKGFQITRQQLNLFKEHHNLNIDIHKLFNTIMKNSIFSQMYINTSGYCYNSNYKFSRQFKLTLTFNKTKDILSKIIKNIIYYINKYKEILTRPHSDKIEDIMFKVLLQLDMKNLCDVEFEFT